VYNVSVRCTVYSVQCTMYNVQFTVYSVQCTMYSVQCTVYNIQCTMYSVQCTVYSVQCTVYNVQCTMYSVQCTVYSVQTSTQLPTTRPYFILGLIRIMHAPSINHKFRIYVDFGATSSKPYPDNQYVLQLPTPLLQPPLSYSDIQYVRPGPTFIQSSERKWTNCTTLLLLC